MNGRYVEVRDDAKVFVSYSRKDREKAQRISEALRDRHFGVFRDTDDILPTEEWKGRLEQLIAEADTIVFLLSPASSASEVCAWEVEHATSLGKRIAPIVIEDVDASMIPPTLARLNFIFATDRDPFENAVASLASALNTDIDWIREHTRLGGLAARWEQTGRPARLLLRGQDVTNAEAWRDLRPIEAPSPTPLHLAFLAQSRRAVGRRLTAWIGGSMAVAAASVALAVIAYLQSVEANNQRQLAETNADEARLQQQAAEENAAEAEKQRASADSQRQIAEERRIEAEHQRNEAFKTQSLFLADLSLQRLEDGDVGSAMALAWEAAPHDPMLAERPFLPEVHRALAQSRSANRVRLFLRTEGSEISQVAFIDNDQSLITMSSGGNLQLWSTLDGREIISTPYRNQTISLLRISPNRRRVAAAHKDAAATIWNTGADKDEYVELKGVTDTLSDMQFSANGSFIFGAFSNTVATWDAHTGNMISKISHHRNPVDQILVSANDEYIAYEGDGALRVFWRKSKEIVMRMDVGQYDIHGFQFSPDGSYLAISVLNSVHIIELPTGKEAVVLNDHSAGVYNVQFDPTGTRMISHSSDATARLWSVPHWREIAVLTGHRRSVAAARFSPDGRHVVTGGHDSARLWRSSDGALIAVLRGHNHQVDKLAFSPDGMFLTTGAQRAAINDRSFDNSIRQWRVMDGNPVASLRAHEGNIRSIEYSSNGALLASGSEDGNVIIWSASPEKTLLQIHTDFTDVNDLLFHPDGKRLFIAGSHGSVQVWNWRSKNLIGKLQGHSMQVYDIAYDRNLDVLATTSADGTVRLWSAANYSEVASFSESERPYHVEFVPGRNVLLSWSFDKSVYIWDVDKKQFFAQITNNDDQYIPPPQKLVAGDRERGFAARVVSEGRHEFDIELLEIAASAVIQRVAERQAYVTSMDISPDWSVLASGGFDGTVRIWQIWPDPVPLIEKVGELIRYQSPLSQKERCEYFIDQGTECRSP